MERTIEKILLGLACPNCQRKDRLYLRKATTQAVYINLSNGAMQGCRKDNPLPPFWELRCCSGSCNCRLVNMNLMDLDEEEWELLCDQADKQPRLP
jgi:hypothetical protein